MQLSGSHSVQKLTLQWDGPHYSPKRLAVIQWIAVVCESLRMNVKLHAVAASSQGR
jgi:hypothetical protein